MSNYKELIPEFVKCSDKVKRITTPLKDQFGLSYFYYYSLDAFGNLTLLTDHPEIDEYYFTQRMFLNDPYLRHPNHYRSGFFSMEAFGSDDYKSDQKKIFGAFDLHPSISLIEGRPDSFDFFGFLRTGGPNISSYPHLNHLSLLKSFTSYFKNEFEPVILSMKKSSFSILELVGRDEFYKGLSIIPTIERDKIRSFLMEIGKKSEVLKFDSLSRREQQCLKALINGKSAKDTAIELCLSHRTIEHHLENCKLKLSCWNKQELFSIGRLFEELGLLL